MAPWKQDFLKTEVKSFLVMQLDAIGRADESLAVEFVGPLKPKSEDSLQNEKSLSIYFQKGQLKANICFQSFHSVNLEVPVFIVFIFFYF